MECGGRWLRSGAGERRIDVCRALVCDGSARYSGKCQSALMEVLAVRPGRIRSGNAVINRLLCTDMYIEDGFL